MGLLPIRMNEQGELKNFIKLFFHFQEFFGSTKCAILQRKWSGVGFDDNSLQDSLSVTPCFCLSLLRRIKNIQFFKKIRYYLIELVSCQPAVK